MRIALEKILNLEGFLFNSKSIIYFSIDLEGNLLVSEVLHPSKPTFL